MSSEIMKELTKPFDAHMVKQRQGPGGIMLDYVEGSSVIRRLLACIPNYSFTIVEQSRLDAEIKEIVVKGRLETDIEGVKTLHEQFGSATVGKGADAYGNAYKSAATDALKKCATHLGVALELYESDTEESDDTGEVEKKTDNRAGMKTESTGPNAWQSQPCTDKQRGLLKYKASQARDVRPDLADRMLEAASDANTTRGDIDALMKEFDAPVPEPDDMPDDDELPF